MFDGDRLIMYGLFLHWKGLVFLDGNVDRIATRGPLLVR